jgi:protein-S-isoprenylcysteine O-methyltransferase Ste14
MRLKHKFYIDTHKGMNAVAILALIAAHDAWHNETAWIYLALHGTYGLLWILKSKLFGDKNWEQEVDLWYGLATWLSLTAYWIGPWVIVRDDLHAAPWLLALCVAMWGLGVFMHFAADMQKHSHMRLAPGTLLQDGLWSRLRNPNYFGELLIYLSFCLLSRHPLPMLVLGGMIAGVWLPNMIKKDRSLSRYPEFAAWKARSWLFVPGLF